MIYAAATLALLVAVGMALTRALLGPTVYDRVLAANTVGTKAVLLIAVLGFLNDRPEFTDIALVYALINFIGTLAVLKFFKFSHLGHPHVGESGQPSRDSEI